MSSRVLNSDVITGITTIFHPSDDGNTFTIETKQDCTDLVEANRRAYNSVDERARYAGDGFHRVANVPLSILFHLKKIGKLDPNDSKPFLRWLDDSDHKDFRTRPGRLSR